MVRNHAVPRYLPSTGGAILPISPLCLQATRQSRRVPRQLSRHNGFLGALPSRIQRLHRATDQNAARGLISRLVNSPFPLHASAAGTQDRSSTCPTPRHQARPIFQPSHSRRSILIRRSQWILFGLTLFISLPAEFAEGFWNLSSSLMSE